MDRLTGLGETLNESLKNNGSKTIGEAYLRIKMEYANAERLTANFNAFQVTGGYLRCANENIVKMDDLAYMKLCQLLDIPTAYLLKLPAQYRQMNVDYWFTFGMKDKELTVTYNSDMELLEIEEGQSIRLEDVFRELDGIYPDMYLWKTTEQTNATQFDFIDYSMDYEMGDNVYYGGVRYLHKKGLKAPEINPLLVDADSCGCIEFADYYPKLNIKGWSYSEIIKQIGIRFKDCVLDMDKLFARAEHVANDGIENAHRRTALYCKEHTIPERITNRVLEQLDDIETSGGWQGGATVYDLAHLFSVSGYLDTVKQTSERKLQSLAGYVILMAENEHRCEKCDNRLIER